MKCTSYICEMNVYVTHNHRAHVLQRTSHRCGTHFYLHLYDLHLSRLQILPPCICVYICKSNLLHEIIIELTFEIHVIYMYTIHTIHACIYAIHVYICVLYFYIVYTCIHVYIFVPYLSIVYLIRTQTHQHIYTHLHTRYALVA